MRVTPSRVLPLCALALAALTVALLALPLARFPDQDLLWNDLYLASKVAFSTDAWRNALGGVVDFSQGLGELVTADPKAVPHLFDPAALLGLLMPLQQALLLRTFALALLGAWGLASTVTNGKLHNLSIHGFAIVVASLAVPQFFFHDALFFYSIFLCLPALHWTLVAFARDPRPASWLCLLGVAATTISVSDIHMIGFALIVPMFAWAIEPSARTRAMLWAGLATFALTLSEYAPTIASILKGAQNTNGLSSPTTLTAYVAQFVVPALLTIVVPVFAGPVSLYLNPVVVSFFEQSLRRTTGRQQEMPQNQEARIVYSVVIGSAVLVFGGTFLYAFPTLSSRLPSLLRYHLALIPYFVTIGVCSIHAHTDQTAPASPQASSKRLVAGFTLASAFAGASLTAITSMNARAPIEIWQRFSFAEKILFRLHELPSNSDAVLKGAFAALGVIGFSLISWRILQSNTYRALRSQRPARYLLSAAAVCALLFAGNFFQSFLGSKPWRWWPDIALSKALVTELPSCVQSLARGSLRAGEAISLLPAAKAVDQAGTGRNDKLMPLIELPDFMGGRSAFQWRYSYSTLSAATYASLTGDLARRRNFWPPEAVRLRDPAEAARQTGANILIVADTTLSDRSLQHLGTCPVLGDAGGNVGLTGTVEVYGLLRRAEQNNLRGTIQSIHRTFLTVEPQRNGVLPVAYHRELRARWSNGRPARLAADSLGMATLIGQDSSTSDELLTVSSRDSARLAFPLLLCVLAVTTGLVTKPHGDTTQG